MTTLVPEAKLFRMRRFIIWYEDLVFLSEYMNIFKQFEAIYHINLVFWDLFYCYSATYGLISMKLCMLVKSHLLHDVTEFHKVLSFRLGFIGFGVCLATPLFLYYPFTANQRTKFNIFLIIIDLESPQNITAVVWFRSGKKPRTSSQK